MSLDARIDRLEKSQEPRRTPAPIDIAKAIAFVLALLKHGHLREGTKAYAIAKDFERRFEADADWQPGGA